MTASWSSENIILFVYLTQKTCVEYKQLQPDFQKGDKISIIRSQSCLRQRVKKQNRSLGLEDALEKEMAILSSTIAWKIPWTEEPGRLQSLGSQRVGHD